MLYRHVKQMQPIIYKHLEQKQLAIQADLAYATSDIFSPSTGDLVIQAAQAKTTSYTASPSAGHQLYRQLKHKQPVIQTVISGR